MSAFTEIEADMEAADFSTDATTEKLANKLVAAYCARDLFTFEDMLPNWIHNNMSEKLRCERMYNRITSEARSLIVQARTLGAGGIRETLVRGAHGEWLPHPQMLDDLDDGMYDMTVVALRRFVARAMERNASIQDVAHKVDAARGEISAVGADAHAGRVAAEIASAKPPRADKGKKTVRKYRRAATVDGVRLTAKWLAGVLNGSRFRPEKGAELMGTCDERRIQQWDSWCDEHPGEANCWGYRTELRTDGKRFGDLKKFINEWKCFWKTYKTEFDKWRRNHPNNAREDFRPSRAMMKRCDIDPERMGIDADGGIVIRPVTDDEKAKVRKAMSRHGLTTKYLGRQYQ